MQLSKIGSKSTYHRCIKELNHWKYIVYFPSHNPYRGSKIKMFKFETSTEQALVSIYQHIQTIKNKNSNKQENFKNSDLKDFENDDKHDSTVSYSDNLKTIKDKNYNEPL